MPLSTHVSYHKNSSLLVYTTFVFLFIKCYKYQHFSLSTNFASTLLFAKGVLREVVLELVSIFLVLLKHH